MNEVLWISFIGAALVILGLILLWFFMDILVRLTNIRRKNKHENNDSAIDEDKEIDLECKQKAAAASIAVAMVLLNTSFLPTKQKNSQQMSAWQVGHRNQQVYNRTGTTFKDRENK